MNTRLTGTIFVSALLFIPGLSHAGTMTMPAPGDRMYVSVAGTNCIYPVVIGAGTCPGAGSASGVLPIQEFTHPFWETFDVDLIGGGSTSANSLQIYLETNTGFGRTTAVIEDTYVLNGPAGAVDIDVALAAEVIIDLVLGPTVPWGQGFSSIRIGTGMSVAGTDG